MRRLTTQIGGSMNRGQWAKYVRSYLERMIKREARDIAMSPQEMKQWADESRWLLELLDGNEQEIVGPKPVEPEYTGPKVVEDSHDNS